VIRPGRRRESRVKAERRPGGSPDLTALPHIVLVHGAWADGSSWRAVIQHLQADGYRVTAPQFPLTRLADDVARPRQVLARQNGPAVVREHPRRGDGRPGLDVAADLVPGRRRRPDDPTRCPAAGVRPAHGRYHHGRYARLSCGCGCPLAAVVTVADRPVAAPGRPQRPAGAAGIPCLARLVVDTRSRRTPLGTGHAPRPPPTGHGRIPGSRSGRLQLPVTTADQASPTLPTSPERGDERWLVPPLCSSTARSLTRPAFAVCITSFSAKT
jgi:hypothetical protein